MTPTQLVEKQLSFYNARDIDGFLSCYSDTVTAFNFGETNPIMNGISDFRERYGKRFQDPKLHCKILNRIAIGSTVIDEELVTTSEAQSRHIVVMYTIQDEKISQVRFIR